MSHIAATGKIRRRENNQRPVSTADLNPTEKQFLTAMQQISFGRFEHLPIRDGDLVLSPWPASVREVRFGSEGSMFEAQSGEFDLKAQVVELFTFVRSVDFGAIRCLQIKHGIPFLMELEDPPKPAGGPK